MLDVISIGDARIDNVLVVSEAHVECTFNKQKCEICLKFGGKIPVEQIFTTVAGNNANNSVALSRLGIKTALFANTGDDENGKRILDYLKKEGVDTKYIKLHPKMAAEISTIISFKGERTILVFHQPWVYNLPDFERTKWVYLSSTSYSFTQTDFISQIEHYVERIGCKMVFAPGTYQLKYGIKKFPRLLRLVNILIVNKEEAKEILGIDEAKKIDIKKLLEELFKLGPQKIVITDGAEGSYSFDGENYLHLLPFRAKLVEATGAGDAYAAALMTGLIHGKNLAEAMRWGAANGAAVVEEIGPQAGLLSSDNLQKKLKENSKIVATKL